MYEWLAKESLMYVSTGFLLVSFLLGLKDFKMILRVTAAQLQLLSDYYYWKDYANRDEIQDGLENKNTYEDNNNQKLPKQCCTKILVYCAQKTVEDYDLWSMRMEQYLTYTDYALWEVIVNGDAPAIASASAGTEGPIPPKTAEEKL
ncbi:hypothetical protein Tco_0847355 [Tanacetum coccineum]